MAHVNKLQWILNQLYERRSPTNIVLTLDRIKKLCKKLGDPHKKIESSSIVTLCTNGKFSTIQYLKSILHEQGYSTNVYTSPETVKVNDRFEFNGQFISDDDFIKYLAEVEKHSEGDETFFEILTAMFFLASVDLPADFYLLEAGLGFAGDTTRLVGENPLATIVVSLSLDHKNFLGDLEGIVKNKIEPISKKTKIVISKQSPEALKLMDAYLKKNPSPQYYFSEQFTANFQNDSIIYSDENSLYDLKKPNFFPDFQLYNLATSIQTAKLISSKKLDTETLNQAISKAKIPGRFQIIGKDHKLAQYFNEETLTILSAAHNLGGAQELRRSLEKLKFNGPIFLIFGMNRSKDLKGFLSQFVDLVTEVRAVELRDGFYSYKEIAECCESIGMKCSNAGKNNTLTPLMQLSISVPKSLICITGSIEMVGNFLRNENQNYDKSSS